MAEYQNLFTRVQVSAPHYHGVPHTGGGIWGRHGSGGVSHLLGRLGDAQIGPVYLGTLGLASLLSGLLAFEIIGLNMWASVGWSPLQFIRQLAWLALEPPAPGYGLTIPPLKDGGWWLMVVGVANDCTSALVRGGVGVYRAAVQAGNRHV